MCGRIATALTCAAKRIEMTYNVPAVVAIVRTVISLGLLLPPAASRALEFPPSFAPPPAEKASMPADHRRTSRELEESAIAALSKLANLRFSSPETVRSLVPEEMAPPEAGTNFREPSPIADSPVEFRRAEFKPRKFQCHPIEDIFIPAVGKNVPAYICSLQSRRFVISSERFAQDYRNHLEVDVDETTFHRLQAHGDTNGTGNSVANVIPVTLTQRLGEQFYGIRKS